jgi:DNA repair protein RadC
MNGQAFLFYNYMKIDISQKVAEIEVSYRPAISNKPIITSSLDAYNVIKEFIPASTIALQEQFVCMYLNRANRVIGVYNLSMGGITGTVADTRLVLGIALKVAATGIILAHNHPSGNLKPSSADEALTEKIKTAASFMDILVSDHLILSANGEYYSFADEGLL